MDRIIRATNLDTGELLNPYQLVGSMGGSETLESLTWRVMPAIKALKFFTLSTRGFAMRERAHVVQFTQEVANVSAYSKDEIEGWVIDEFKKIGLDTAKSVLSLSVSDLVKRTDLEEETVEDVLSILRSEFE